MVDENSTNDKYITNSPDSLQYTDVSLNNCLLIYQRNNYIKAVSQAPMQNSMLMFMYILYARCLESTIGPGQDMSFSYMENHKLCYCTFFVLLVLIYKAVIYCIHFLDCIFLIWKATRQFIAQVFLS